ncbi:MAG: hypothetical protein JSU69_08850 [Candidatus Zixiibacteriota bacterium]|nr:MAG: hypothetical protein JSU69_08850 [candidate division Zixibacteria bacterium]
MSNGQNHVVVIFNDGNTVAVAPGQVVAAKEDTVTFKNITQSSVVTLVFPDEDIFKGIATVSLTPESPNTRKRTLTVDTEEMGSYPYTVYHSSSKEFAHASIPNIIVYRRD